jgi:hypothetical protein
MALDFPNSPTVGQVFGSWTWDGTKWAPTGVVPASGSKVLITSVTIAAAVASVDFFSGFDGTYDELELEMYDLQPATEAASYLRCSVDGSTFDIGADYSYAASFSGTSTPNTPGGFSGNGVTFGQISNQQGTSAAWAYLNRIKLRLGPAGNNPHSCWTFQSQSHSSVTYASASGGGEYLNGVPVLGLRVFFAGAVNITRGILKLYGIVK